MIEIKTLGGGLNMDDSLYKIKPNDYIQALNISHDAVAESNDQDISSVLANQVADPTYVLPVGANLVIGSISNNLRNTIIDFRWNSNNFHRISQFDGTTRTYSTILENLTDSAGVDILGFTEHDKITSINIYNREEGDLLYFLDSLGRPTEIDLPLIPSYIPVTRDIIDKARNPPLSPPSVIYSNDTPRRSNNFRNKLFRFKYRWNYKNLEKSTFSPISIVPLPDGILSDVYTGVITNNNVITISANTGDKSVVSTELAMSYVEKTNDWSDFQSITVTKKSDLILHQTTLTQTNDTTYTSFTTFLGVPVEGDVVNVYFIQLPNTEVLAGTYSVVLGDDVNDVATGVSAGLITGGLVVGAIANLNVSLYSYNRGLYNFSRIEIIPSSISTLDNRAFAFNFYNDSTYPNIPIEESIQLFDWVPKQANAQESPNGNTLVYAGITEGYNKDTFKDCIVTVNTVAADVGGLGAFYAVRTIIEQNSDLQNLSFALNGIPIVGTVVEIKVKRRTDHVVLTASTYTTVLGDTIYTVEVKMSQNSTLEPLVHIFYNAGKVGVVVRTSLYEIIDDIYYSEMIITPPGVSPQDNSMASWKWSSDKTIARAYFDKKGVTNGILYTDKVTFPEYAENGSSQALLPYINYKINDIPPDWAWSMQFYATKDATFYIYWASIGTNKDETAYIYLNVSNFKLNADKKPTTATVLSYTFQDGDRVRVIKNITTLPNIVLNDTYDIAIEGLVTDPTINFVPITGTFIKIKNLEPFTTGLSATDRYVLEIYRPAQQQGNESNQVFYEFGQEYSIIDPETSTRRHSGQVTDQVIGVTPAEYNFYEGDTYFRERTIPVSEVGYATFVVMDKNFVDNYVSAVNSIDGRANIIDINAKRAYYSTLIRFSQLYDANTNVNGLNRFYSKNFDQYDYSYGDVERLYVMDRFMRVFQRDKIGMVPLYSSLGKDANGLDVVFQTDKLLNPIQYYKGNVGIGTAKESLAASNYANYGCDNIRGLIWRVSNDGVVIISLLYHVNSWATENLPMFTEDKKIYGCFDQRLNNYVVTLNEEPSVCAPVFVNDFSFPDALLDSYYYYSVSLNGTLDFVIDNVVSPSWMTVTLLGNIISFSGVPDVEGDGLPISFDVSNPCGLISINKTLNVSDMAPGIIVMWSGNPAAVPAGFLLCDGTSGTPNLSGLFIVGYSATDPDYNAIGAMGGEKTHTLTLPEIPAHTHTYLKVIGGASFGDNSTNQASVTDNTGSAGGGGAHENRPPYYTLAYIIKT